MSKIAYDVETNQHVDDYMFSDKLDNKEMRAVILQNDCEMTAVFTNYGARIIRWLVPDSNGNKTDIILGYNDIQSYLNSKEFYFGATVGRFANRIAEGKFNLDGKTYQLEVNNDKNHLHGGTNGLHTKVWDAYQLNRNQVLFRHISEDGENGYPGKIQIEVSYNLTNNGELIIDYQAFTTKKTILNLTNHAYFNLSGAGKGSIENHELYLNADYFTPITQNAIPTGEIRQVNDTVFDFRKSVKIGSVWNAIEEQIQNASGFDHNFVLNKKTFGSLELAARMSNPENGITLEVETTEPGIQFYTGNWLTGNDIGREGIPYVRRSAFCLETQHFPDSPNQPLFPSVVLLPDNYFKSTTIYRIKKIEK